MPAKKLITRVMQRYWRATRSLTMGAQGVVIDADDRVLLVRHTYRPGWHFPGGGVEANETVELALVRELREEAGILINGTPQLFGIYGNFAHFPSDHVALFIIRDWRRPNVPKPNREIADNRFYSRDDLPKNLHHTTARRLEEVFNAAPRDPMW